MYSCVKTCSLMGLEGNIIDVETDLSAGMPKFSIVGLPDSTIKESKERVESAIKNSGIKFPLKRIVINLAPANIKKDGSQMDLPLAIGILKSDGRIKSSEFENFIIIGELSLDGNLNRIDGALPMVISARDKGFKNFIVPFANGDECGVIEDVNIYPCQTLMEVVEFLNKEREIKRYKSSPFDESVHPKYDVDFSEIKGQQQLKRGLEITAAGAHNFLSIGSPGSGKTMGAIRLPTIMPDMSFEEAIEVTKIYSIAGLLKDNKLMTKRPFRSPHHTASRVAIIGGGKIPKPGEISLAHNGVLFMDELPEFDRSVIEVLRQPLEDGIVHISRVNASLSFPSKFIFMAAMNPCPCGYHNDPNHECNCSLNEINRYLNKISQPMLDRLDIHLEIKPVKYKDLTSDEKTESSESIRKRVNAARKIQLERYKDLGFYANSQIPNSKLKKYCKIDNKTQKILELAFNKYKFSGRSYNKILKVARTIADLENCENIMERHVLEAIRYRVLDNKYWGN
ncbi:MAG: YifB family Mg chelatase-like AAA ATPase [Tissierellia bacterium]|nr:YifB family Mg chelatase-like AAA ATPase [Tissierellia bacterium]